MVNKAVITDTYLIKAVEINKNQVIQTAYDPALIKGPDPLSFWYKSLESLGESVVFNFGTKSNSGMDWDFYKHESFDGLSAITDYFQKKFNQTIEVPKLHESFGPPGFFKGIIGGINYQINRDLPKFEWKHRDFSKGITFSKQEKQIITLEFSPKESKELFKKLKETKTNFNCLCMLLLNQFIVENFIKSHQGKFLWMLPVNMRGHLGDDFQTNNQSSYLDLVLEEGESPESLRQKMINKMNRKEHWYVWYGARMIPKHFSENAFMTIKKHLLNGGPPYMGNFSNLGRFNLPVEIEKPIFFGTNVTRVRPIGIGLLSVNDHLTLTMQFHETLGLKNEEVKELQTKLTALKEKF